MNLKRDDKNSTSPGDGQAGDPDNDPTDVITEAMMKTTLDDIYTNDDHLMFGERINDADLSALHPAPAQIFKLWQIYQDNVDPLLKVTHGPSLQARIVDAMGSLQTIDSTLEALLFSIYSMAILSLDKASCYATFGAAQDDLMSGYQFGCQQALLSCGVFKSNDREGLTALFLYLISARPATDPRTLFLTLGMAVRLAQRIGIHDESANSQCNVLEAEMRRRLWWSLIIFDNRISEMSASKTTMLLPLWDCKIPLNVSDHELREDMKTPPTAHATPTEAWFVVVRAEMDEYMRNCPFQLDFVSPALKLLSRNVRPVEDPSESELADLVGSIEERYLVHCNKENPLQLMTACFSRDYLAKNQLLEHFSKSVDASEPSKEQSQHATALALEVLECDTTLMASPLTQGYLWMVSYHFPFPAYINLVQDLKRDPTNSLAGEAWQAMDINYRVRCEKMPDAGLFLKVTSKHLLQAWAVYAAALRVAGQPVVVPRVVLATQAQVAHLTNKLAFDVQNGDLAQYQQPGFGYADSIVGGQTAATSSVPSHMMSMDTAPVFDVNQIDWASIDWSEMEKTW
ncbi:hypothetical protein LTR86_002263 [Recurvomyces mirabilis]|nr:hypothetical protein LTR86_002263 [Recurvomyces mirabilis]